MRRPAVSGRVPPPLPPPPLPQMALFQSVLFHVLIYIVMDRSEMLRRFACYCAVAMKDLNDSSYMERWAGRAGDVTEEDYCGLAADIQSRLLAAGLIKQDEDPYETIMAGRP